ncbi:hypothetical protein OIDMADRAFT_17323, partial [Oidiodendron maius Zn]
MACDAPRAGLALAVTHGCGDKEGKSLLFGRSIDMTALPCHRLPKEIRRPHARCGWVGVQKSFFVFLLCCLLSLPLLLLNLSSGS